MNPKFISIEGLDGAGKTSLAQGLAQWLRSRGCDVLVTREPGDGPIGPKIRDILLHGENIDPWTEVFLFLADRRQHCEEVIRPSLEHGTWVVCDRFTDSTVVYQGYGRDLPVEQLRKMNNFATSGLEPDLVLLLDLPIEIALERVSDKNRLDAESAQFHQLIREGFAIEARRNPNRWAVLDATLPANTVLELATARVSKLMAAASLS